MGLHMGKEGAKSPVRKRWTGQDAEALEKASRSRALCAIFEKNEEALAKEILAARRRVGAKSPTPGVVPGEWLSAAAAEGWLAGVEALAPVSDLLHVGSVDWSRRPYELLGSADERLARRRRGDQRDGDPKNSARGQVRELDKYGRHANLFGAGRKASALGLACLNGHEQCARVIFDAWRATAGDAQWLPKSALARNDDARSEGNRDHESAASWAARVENASLLALLLAIGARPEAPGSQPALLAAFGEKQGEPRPAGTRALRLLILAGANREARSSSPGLMGMTPLGIAAARGWPAVAKMLIESGARIDAKDAQGRGVLMLALAGQQQAWERACPEQERRERAELAKMLLEAGAEANAEPRRWTSGMATPLMVAIGRGNEAAAKAIEERLAENGIVGARESAKKSLAEQDLWDDNDCEGPDMWDDDDCEGPDNELHGQEWDDGQALETAVAAQNKNKKRAADGSLGGDAASGGGRERLAAAQRVLRAIAGKPKPMDASKSCGPRRARGS